MTTPSLIESNASHAAVASHSYPDTHSRCISLCIISAKIHCNAWLNGSSPPPRPFTARTCISPSCLVSFVGTTVSEDSSCFIWSLNGCHDHSFRTRSFASCSFWYKVCCLCFMFDKGMNLRFNEKYVVGRIHPFSCLAQWFGRLLHSMPFYSITHHTIILIHSHCHRLQHHFPF
jgi:hypothetical protein